MQQIEWLSWSAIITVDYQKSMGKTFPQSTARIASTVNSLLLLINYTIMSDEDEFLSEESYEFEFEDDDEVDIQQDQEVEQNSIVCWSLGTVPYPTNTDRKPNITMPRD